MYEVTPTPSTSMLVLRPASSLVKLFTVFPPWVMLVSWQFTARRGYGETLFSA
ncbi:MAG: hypothetical protein IT202_03780 [Fimbriimonadaceae bacterium]|nr:hypothetical protein [Fimbriimonadaceae bacterium]